MDEHYLHFIQFCFSFQIPYEVICFFVPYILITAKTEFKSFVYQNIDLTVSLLQTRCFIMFAWAKRLASSSF